MTDQEKIKELFNELKNCTATDISNRFSLISDLFPLLTKQEQNENARDFYTWAKENAAQQPLKFCYAKFLSAFNSFFHEQYESTLVTVTEVQKQFEEQNDSGGIAICLALLGGVYRTLGNVDLALKTLWEGYRQLKQSDINPHFLSACSYNLGSIYLEMGNFEEAIQLFKNTYEQAEKAQDFFFVNYALHNLGKTYLLQKKYHEAKEFLDEAMANAEKNKNPLAISNSLTELANYHFQAGNFTEAEQLHQQALTIREGHKFIGGAITNCIRLAEVYIKQFKPDEALVVLRKGLKLAEQIKVKPKQYQIHLLLSEIYKGKNELEKSLFHYRLYHEIHEQVELEDSAKKLKNAQLIFEAEQTKKENTTIRKQKAEIEKKNIELQDTIDELTRAKIGKKAKAFTLMLAIVLFIFEDSILRFVLTAVSSDNYFISLIIKMAIIFSLNPINGAIERYLLKKVVKKKEKEVFIAEVVAPSTTLSFI